MRHASPDRRRFLLACAAVAPGLAAPSAARAFRREALGAADRAAYAAEACAAPEGLHEALRGGFAAALAGGDPPEEMRRAIEALVRCPWCGCAVLGADDHGEGAGPPGPPAAPPRG